MKQVIHGITVCVTEQGTEGPWWVVNDVRSLPRPGEDLPRYVGHWGQIAVTDQDRLVVWDIDYETELFNSVHYDLSGINPNTSGGPESNWRIPREFDSDEKRNWWYGLFKGKPCRLTTWRDPYTVGYIDIPEEGWQGFHDFSIHRNVSTLKRLAVMSDGSVKFVYANETEEIHNTGVDVPWEGTRIRSLRLMDWLNNRYGEQDV